MSQELCVQWPYLEVKSLETSKIAWTTLAWRLHFLSLRQALYANQF